MSFLSYYTVCRRFNCTASAFVTLHFSLFSPSFPRSFSLCLSPSLSLFVSRGFIFSFTYFCLLFSPVFRRRACFLVTPISRSNNSLLIVPFCVRLSSSYPDVPIRASILDSLSHLLLRERLRPCLRHVLITRIFTADILRVCSPAHRSRMREERVY